MSTSQPPRTALRKPLTVSWSTMVSSTPRSERPGCGAASTDCRLQFPRKDAARQPGDGWATNWPRAGRRRDDDEALVTGGRRHGTVPVRPARARRHHGPRPPAPRLSYAACRVRGGLAAMAATKTARTTARPWASAPETWPSSPHSGSLAGLPVSRFLCPRRSGNSRQGAWARGRRPDAGCRQRCRAHADSVNPLRRFPNRPRRRRDTEAATASRRVAIRSAFRWRWVRPSPLRPITYASPSRTPANSLASCSSSRTTNWDCSPTPRCWGNP